MGGDPPDDLRAHLPRDLRQGLQDPRCVALYVLFLICVCCQFWLGGWGRVTCVYTKTYPSIYTHGSPPTHPPTHSRAHRLPRQLLSQLSLLRHGPLRGAALLGLRRHERGRLACIICVSLVCIVCVEARAVNPTYTHQTHTHIIYVMRQSTPPISTPANHTSHQTAAVAGLCGRLAPDALPLRAHGAGRLHR